MTVGTNSFAAYIYRSVAWCLNDDLRLMWRFRYAFDTVVIFISFGAMPANGIIVFG